jgi:hypothetical protein
MSHPLRPPYHWRHQVRSTPSRRPLCSRLCAGPSSMKSMWEDVECRLLPCMITRQESSQTSTLPQPALGLQPAQQRPRIVWTSRSAFINFCNKNTCRTLKSTSSHRSCKHRMEFHRRLHDLLMKRNRVEAGLENLLNDEATDGTPLSPTRDS